jgi:hypothetical protein
MSHKRSGVNPDGTREVTVTCRGYIPGVCDLPNGSRCAFGERFTVLLPVGENSLSLGECQHRMITLDCVRV